MEKFSFDPDGREELDLGHTERVGKQNSARDGMKQGGKDSKEGSLQTIHSVSESSSNPTTPTTQKRPESSAFASYTPRGANLVPAPRFSTKEDLAALPPRPRMSYVEAASSSVPIPPSREATTTSSSNTSSKLPQKPSPALLSPLPDFDVTSSPTPTPSPISPQNLALPSTSRKGKRDVLLPIRPLPRNLEEGIVKIGVPRADRFKVKPLTLRKNVKGEDVKDEGEGGERRDGSENDKETGKEGPPTPELEGQSSGVSGTPLSLALGLDSNAAFSTPVPIPSSSSDPHTSRIEHEHELLSFTTLEDEINCLLGLKSRDDSGYPGGFAPQAPLIIMMASTSTVDYDDGDDGNERMSKISFSRTPPNSPPAAANPDPLGATQSGPTPFQATPSSAPSPPPPAIPNYVVPPVPEDQRVIRPSGAPVPLILDKSGNLPGGDEEENEEEEEERQGSEQGKGKGVDESKWAKVKIPPAKGLPQPIKDHKAWLREDPNDPNRRVGMQAMKEYDELLNQQLYQNFKEHHAAKTAVEGLEKFKETLAETLKRVAEPGSGGGGGEGGNSEAAARTLISVNDRLRTQIAAMITNAECDERTRREVAAMEQEKDEDIRLYKGGVQGSFGALDAPEELYKRIDELEKENTDLNRQNEDLQVRLKNLQAAAQVPPKGYVTEDEREERYNRALSTLNEKIERLRRERDYQKEQAHFHNEERKKIMQDTQESVTEVSKALDIAFDDNPPKSSQGKSLPELAKTLREKVQKMKDNQPATGSNTFTQEDCDSQKRGLEDRINILTSNKELLEKQLQAKQQALQNLQSYGKESVDTQLPGLDSNLSFRDLIALHTQRLKTLAEQVQREEQDLARTGILTGSDNLEALKRRISEFENQVARPGLDDVARNMNLTIPTSYQAVIAGIQAIYHLETDSRNEMQRETEGAKKLNVKLEKAEQECDEEKKRLKDLLDKKNTEVNELKGFNEKSHKMIEEFRRQYPQHDFEPPAPDVRPAETSPSGPAILFAITRVELALNEMLNARADIGFREQDTDNALNAAREAVAMADELGEPNWQGRAYHWLSVAQYYADDNAAALMSLERAKIFLERITYPRASESVQAWLDSNRMESPVPKEKEGYRKYLKRKRRRSSAGSRPSHGSRG